jgi:hypothetical protein
MGESMIDQCVEAKASSPIDLELSEIGYALNRLDDIIQVAWTRFAPALGPAPPSETHDTRDASGGSRLACELSGIYGRVDAAAARLHALTNLCEL